MDSISDWELAEAWMPSGFSVELSNECGDITLTQSGAGRFDDQKIFLEPQEAEGLFKVLRDIVPIALSVEGSTRK